jgi:hypothetical protein
MKTLLIMVAVALGQGEAVDQDDDGWGHLDHLKGKLKQPQQAQRAKQPQQAQRGQNSRAWIVPPVTRSGNSDWRPSARHGSNKPGSEPGSGECPWPKNGPAATTIGAGA